MRIAMLLSNGFGPDPRVAAEALALREAGHQIVIFAWDRTGQLPPSEDYRGIKIIRCPVRTTYSKGPLQIFKFKRFWEECRRFLAEQHPEAVHCHDLDTLQPGIRYGQENGIPVVFDAHESYPDMVTHLFPAPLVWLIRRLEARLVPRAAAVITVGTVLGARFHGLRARQVVVVGNYKSLSGTSEGYGGKHTPLQIVYVGGLNRDRLLAPLLQAAAGMPEFQIRIVGDGPERVRLEGAAGGAANIQFTGFLAPDKARAVVDASDLVYYAIDATYPNNRYSAPNSLFLALAAGKPLIVTPIGEVAQIVGEEDCGTVLEDLQPETIRRALAQYHEPTFWEKQAANSLNAARSKYNWDAAKYHLLEVYRQIEKGD